MCERGVGDGGRVWALGICTHSPELPRGRSDLQQGECPGPAWLVLKLVGGCRATAPPAGRLPEGPGAVYTGADALLPDGPDLPIHPPGLTPGVGLGLLGA